MVGSYLAVCSGSFSTASKVFLHSFNLQRKGLKGTCKSIVQNLTKCFDEFVEQESEILIVPLKVDEISRGKHANTFKELAFKERHIYRER